MLVFACVRRGPLPSSASQNMPRLKHQIRGLLLSRFRQRSRLRLLYVLPKASERREICSWTASNGGLCYHPTLCGGRLNARAATFMRKSRERPSCIKGVRAGWRGSVGQTLLAGMTRLIIAMGRRLKRNDLRDVGECAEASIPNDVHDANAHREIVERVIRTRRGTSVPQSERFTPSHPSPAPTSETEASIAIRVGMFDSVSPLER